ncbi:MAG: radical SAM protein [Clostridiales bacterium]|nr:radical SAM protein [Clostridiales bacterium]
MDREAFIVISIISASEIVDMDALLELPISYKGRMIGKKSIRKIILRLIDLGIFESMPKGFLNEESYRRLEENSRMTIKWPAYTHLSAPETVHWALTYKCGEDCPDCYMERHKREFTSELNTQEAFKLIDKISDAEVFQLAIGGGEPFLRDDLEALAAYAHKKGLVTHITTGRYEIESRRLQELSKYIKVLQIGIKTEELLNSNAKTNEKLKALVAQLNEFNIITGANLIMTGSTIKNLDYIMEVLLELGFKRFTFLRYKPPVKVGRWLKEKPYKDDIWLLENKLDKLKENEKLHIRIDCAFAFLQRELSQQIAEDSGFKGCTAGERIISLAPDGSVFPCSQLTGASFNAGNLLIDDFDTIWNKSSILKKYRGFRTNKSFKNDDCGKCTVKNFCGGCRVFASDAIGSDPGCPDPLYEDKYIDEENDVIAEIQDDIGYTDAGFPYARREDIEKWLEEENDRGYPAWINSTR